MKFIYDDGQMIQVAPESKVRKFLRSEKSKYTLSVCAIGAMLLFYFLLDGGMSILAFKVYSILDSLGWSNLIQHAFRLAPPVAI